METISIDYSKGNPKPSLTADQAETEADQIADGGADLENADAAVVDTILLEQTNVEGKDRKKSASEIREQFLRLKFTLRMKSAKYLTFFQKLERWLIFN